MEAFAWGPEGFHLLVSGRRSFNELLQFGFVKSCLATNPNLVSTPLACALSFSSLLSTVSALSATFAVPINQIRVELPSSFCLLHHWNFG